jgi:iron uptake system EfeUOB component EfeO/EfeM
MKNTRNKIIIAVLMFLLILTVIKYTEKDLTEINSNLSKLKVILVLEREALEQDNLELYDKLRSEFDSINKVTEKMIENEK